MVSGFYDLNIVVRRKNVNHMKVLIDTLKVAYRLGYNTVAVNTILDPDALQGKKGKQAEIPVPLIINPDEIAGVKDSKRNFRILQRITVIINDAAQTHKLQTSQEVKQYDILAVQPENDKAFQVCCTSLDVDIISFPITSRLQVFVKHEQVGMALERGIFFEIFYVPALWDSNARRHTISNAKNIITNCKKKNVFVSSYADKGQISYSAEPMDIRGPYDVINLCQLFGLKAAQAIDLVTTWGRGVVLKAECRKSGKGVFDVVETSNLPAEDQWKVEKCNNAAPHLINEGTEAPLPPKHKKRKKGHQVSDALHPPKSKKKRTK